jgi:hypothetical protein
VALTRRRSGRLAIELAVVALAFGGLVLGLCGLHVSRAETDTRITDDEARQVTVFGVIATPGSKTADTNLSAFIKTQLAKLLPKHGFQLLDAQSKPIVAGESVTCDLHGYTVVISLVQSVDENGKVQIRCELFQDQDRQFSTLVKTPPNQLFFCQRALKDGSQLLIGVGVR